MTVETTFWAEMTLILDKLWKIEKYLIHFVYFLMLTLTSSNSLLLLDTNLSLVYYKVAPEHFVNLFHPFPSNFLMELPNHLLRKLLSTKSQTTLPSATCPVWSCSWRKSKIRKKLLKSPQHSNALSKLHYLVWTSQIWGKQTQSTLVWKFRLTTSFGIPLPFLHFSLT